MAQDFDDLKNIGAAKADEPGEFTRMFQALREEEPKATPAGGETTSGLPATLAAPPIAHVPAPPVAPTFAPPPAESLPVFAAARPARPDEHGETTQTFRQSAASGSATGIFASPASSTPRSAAPASPDLPAIAAPPPPTPIPAPATPGPNEGFTQVFQQIRRPTSAPPEVAKVEPAPEDFTQIFSSFQAGAKPLSRPYEPPATAAPLTPEQAAPRSHSALAPTPEPPAAAPGEFTQMFRSLNSATATGVASTSSVFAAEPMRAASAPAAVFPAPTSAPKTIEPPAEASFTQLFQAPPQAPAPQLPVAPPRTAQPPDAVFGAPPASGSFTEMFRSPSAARKAAPHPAGSSSSNQPPASAAAQGASSGFTEMFQALGSAPSTPAPAVNTAPYFPPATVAPAAAAGGGEFTRLMQSLEQPSAAAPAPMPIAGPAYNPAPAALSGAALPFFNQAPQSSGAGEFTRVMRGPGFKDQSRPAAPASVAAPVAPGLAIAPAKPEDKPAEKKSGMSKNVVILLVVFNVLLLIALIVLAFMVMKKH